MVRDLLFGVAMNVLTAAGYAWWCWIFPRLWGVDAAGWDVLLTVGIQLTATSFCAVFAASRIVRRLDEEFAEREERSRRFDEDRRAAALRLNPTRAP